MVVVAGDGLGACRHPGVRQSGRHCVYPDSVVTELACGDAGHLGHADLGHVVVDHPDVG